jgi:ATP-dependent Clp protease protease subunit
MSRKSFDNIHAEIEMMHTHKLHLPSRTIWLEGNDTKDEEIDHTVAMRFIKNLKILELTSIEPINVILNTNGGAVEQGMAIYDAIKKSTHHVQITVVGHCESIGTIILQAADTRVLSPNCTVMFHAGAIEVTSVPPAESRALTAYSYKQGEQVDLILFEKINEKRVKDNKALMSKKCFRDMVTRSTWLSAVEAVDMGLADSIE